MPDPKDLKDLIASVTGMDDEAKADLRKALKLQPDDVFKKLTDATDEQKVALQKALGMEPEDDDSLKARVMKLFGLTPTAPEIDPDVPEAVRKAVDEVKASVAKADERTVAVQKKLDDALVTIAKRDRDARVQVMIAKAAKFGNMGAADDISKLLTDVDEKLGSEVLKTVEALLAKGEEAFNQARVFEEVGVTARGEMKDNAIAKVDELAAEITKSDPKKTIEAARAEVWKSHPDLFKQYQSERRKAASAAEED